MTTSSGSTPISTQNLSIPSGPSVSGSSGVVYSLNQFVHRLLLNTSSILFMRRELKFERFERRKTQLKKLHFNSMTIRKQKNNRSLTSLIHPCSTNNALVCQFSTISYEKSSKTDCASVSNVEFVNSENDNRIQIIGTRDNN